MGRFYPSGSDFDTGIISDTRVASFRLQVLTIIMNRTNFIRLLEAVS